jgi:hypothetical protein
MLGRVATCTSIQHTLSDKQPPCFWRDSTMPNNTQDGQAIRHDVPHSVTLTWLHKLLVSIYAVYY